MLYSSLAVWPRTELTVKKKATLADAVAGPAEPPLKLRRIEIIIIERPHPADPHNMGGRRPRRSRKNDGSSEPKKNMVWILEMG